jgi:hypothetical protein
MPSREGSASFGSDSFSSSDESFSSDRVAMTVVTATMKAGSDSISSEIASRHEENDSTPKTPSMAFDEKFEGNEDV